MSVAERPGGLMRRLPLLSWWSGVALLLVGLGCCGLVGPVQAQSEKRVALVVGIEAYTKLKPLDNPRRDAKAVADLLRQHRYDVDHHENLNRNHFERALAVFRVKAHNADEAFVYFAGHGMEAFERGERRNILAPVDVEIDCESRSAYAAMTLDEVLRVIATAKKQIVIIDACRENPFRHCPVRNAQQGFGFSRGALPPIVAETARIIAFSTLEGALAKDGQPGAHSPFADALLATLKADPRALYLNALNATSRTVSRRGQTPSIVFEGSAPETCLAGAGCGGVPIAAPAAVSPPTPAPSTSSAAAREWQDVKDTTSISVLERYLQRHSTDPVYSALALDKLDSLKRLVANRKAENERIAGEQERLTREKAAADAKRDAEERQRADAEAAARRKAAEEARRQPQPGDSFRDCTDGCPEMVVVPAGAYMMGSPAGEEGRDNNEGCEGCGERHGDCTQLYDE